MDDRIELNRLLITGSINEYTPLCVLLEISDAHGIKYEIEDIKNKNFPRWILSSIYKNDNIYINENSINDLSKIARFINNKCAINKLNNCSIAAQHACQFNNLVVG